MITLVRDGAQQGEQGQREDDRRERLHRVHDDDHRVVGLAAEIAGDEADQRPITSAAASPGSATLSATRTP